MNRKRSLLIVLTGSLILSGLLAGCGKKETAESLIKAIQGNYEQTKSVEGEFGFEMNLGVEESGVSMNMDLGAQGQFQTINAPAAMHIDGNMNVDFMGMKMDFEMYSTGTDGKTEFYLNMADQWTKYEEENTDNTEKAETQDIDFANMFVSGLVLADKTEKLDGKEVYVMTGKLNGEALEKQLASVKETMGEGYEKLDLTNMDIPVVFKVYKETKMPAYLELDMGSFMASFFQAMSGEEQGNISTDTCLVTVTFKKYNSVDAIEVPQEARDAAEQNLSDLTGNAGLPTENQTE